MGFFKQLMIFGKTGLQGLPMRVTLFLWAFSRQGDMCVRGFILIAHGRGVYRPGGGCRACVCDGVRDPTRTPAVLYSCQAGVCADASTTRRLHACACAYVCEGAVENSWQSRPRHTRARNKVLLSAALVVPSAQPKVGMRARSATAPCKEKTASDTFCYRARVQQQHDTS